jgi:hypothetical protein
MTSVTTVLNGLVEYGEAEAVLLNGRRALALGGRCADAAGRVGRAFAHARLKACRMILMEAARALNSRDICDYFQQKMPALLIRRQ